MLGSTFCCNRLETNMPRGLRSITVAGQQYRWRFDETLVVIPEGRSGPQLRVKWGWRDWLEPEGPGPEPVVVMPAFVALAIQAGLQHGWTPEINGPPVVMTYTDWSFRLASETDTGTGE